MRSIAGMLFLEDVIFSIILKYGYDIAELSLIVYTYVWNVLYLNKLTISGTILTTKS